MFDEDVGADVLVMAVSEAPGCPMASNYAVNVPVFDELERFDASPAGHSEGHAKFLNRAHTPYWHAVRQLIEQWFTQLPDDAKSDVRARLRSADNRQFHAAFWELYLHESLRKVDCHLTPHPQVPGTTRRPDFLVERDGVAFYLEARAISESDDELTASRRRDRVYDALDRMSSPNFYLWVDVEGEGTSDLRTRSLRLDLQTWLTSLDPDEIHDQLVSSEDIRSVPAFEWKSQDWYLIFRPWPKGPESRGNEELRPLGVFGPGNASIIDDVSPLKRALEDKARAYGRLQHPYVVAVRTSSLFADEFDVLNALYGSLQVQFAFGPNGETVTREVRAPDGFWFGATRWQHRTVSAVLVAHSLQPWTVAQDVPTLWAHPDPEKRLGELPIWRRAVVESGTLQYVPPSISPDALFGLPTHWPGDDPFTPYQ